jgi:pantoate--beta-alanine ligase
MQVFDKIEKMQEWSLQARKQGQTIGLVTTMGYLHAGHLALVHEARKSCDRVVVSIFVNPLQFGQGEDFKEYPRDLSRDSNLLEEAGVDALFAPQASEMYPPGFSTSVEVEGEISHKMCGASRPGHFKGVTTVCTKLFHACLPDMAFFGQKDAQQLIIIKKMVKELNFPMKIIRVPIVREDDGLAMSSRNVYLNKQQRQEALVLIKALKKAEEQIKAGERDIAQLKAEIRGIIATSPEAVVDYIEILNGEDLSELERVSGKVLIALAVKFGKTRLIDNLLVEV